MDSKHLFTQQRFYLDEIKMNVTPRTIMVPSMVEDWADISHDTGLHLNVIKQHLVFSLFFDSRPPAAEMTYCAFNYLRAYWLYQLPTGHNISPNASIADTNKRNHCRPNMKPSELNTLAAVALFVLMVSGQSSPRAQLSLLFAKQMDSDRN